MFRAYIAKTPSAPNADAVRKEIATLEIRVEATIDKLINQAKQLVAQEDDRNYRDADYSALAAAIARTGDISGAKQTALKAAGGFLYANDALSKIAAIQYHTGDAGGAENTILDIGSGSRYGINEKEYSAQSRAYGYIAHLQAIKGDFSGAEATIERERWTRNKGSHYLNVAMEEALAGKRVQALSMLGKAIDICNRDEECQKYDLWMLQGVIWQIQAYLGDTEAAKRTYNALEARLRGYFNPSVDRSTIEELVTGASSNLISFRKGLAFIGDQKLLTVTMNQVGSPDEWIRFPKDKLNDELFIDQQSAIRTIAGKTGPRQIVSGMLEAIENITNRLNEIRTLSKLLPNERL